MSEPPFKLPLFVSMTWLLVAAAADANLTESRPDDPGGVRVVQDDASVPEEVIAIGEPGDPFKAHQYEYMQNTYDARGKGSCLYRQGHYGESFPYLLAAAKRGFKFAQARVSFLYQQGLGTDRDAEAAVGWLSVAAFGKTHPEIRNSFREVWGRIPDQHRPRYERVVEEYRTKYASRLHRVNCDLSHKTGSYMHALTCRFQDEAIHLDIEMILANKPVRFAPPDPDRGAC